MIFESPMSTLLRSQFQYSLLQMCAEFEEITGIPKIKEQFSNEWSKWSSKIHSYAKCEGSRGLKECLDTLDTLGDAREHMNTNTQ